MRKESRRNRQKLTVIFSLGFVICCLWSFLSFAKNDGMISTIKFKDADIKVVIQAIAQKATREDKKINIVISPSVEGLVSIDLEDVDWFSTLDAVLKPYGYNYEWVGESILLVDTVEKIGEREALAKAREGVEPAKTKVFKLNYLDANDTMKTIEPMLSPIGKISVLELTGQAGWEFGSDVTKRSRSEEGKISRTKTLIISDIAKKLDEVDAFLKDIDIMPKQIMIKAKIMEMDRDFLTDIGFSWGTGTSGATADEAQFVPAKEKNGIDIAQAAIRGIAPESSVFGSKASGLDSTDFQFIYKRLTGQTFEVILHALEENVDVKTLSAPNILTLDGQEASMLIGEKFPIVKTEISTETSQITGGSLDYYEDIGIQLNVVPQISGEDENFINMIIHPAVTSSSETIKVVNADETTLVEYPKIISREIETQVMIKDGETIAIGGLYKDVTAKARIGVPILMNLPFVGWIFSRNTNDIEKVELVIFITAKIVKPGELLALENNKDFEKFISNFEKKK